MGKNRSLCLSTDMCSVNMRLTQPPYNTTQHVKIYTREDSDTIANITTKYYKIYMIIYQVVEDSG